MFPGPNAQVHYNEAGEPLGWDYPADDDGPYDDESAHSAAYDNYMEELGERHADGEHEDNPSDDCPECRWLAQQERRG